MSANDYKARQQSKWAWMWLAYTGFLFIEPLMEPSRNLWLGTLAALAIFLAIFAGYLRSFPKADTNRLWVIAATFALGLVTFPWNGGASTFFVYAAAFMPFMLENTRRVVLLMVLECVAILAEGAVFTIQVSSGPFHVGWPNTLIAAFLVIVIGGGNIYFAEQKRNDCRLRAALEENVTLAAVAERERIARDLHDVLGHTLSVIVLKAELAGRLIGLDPSRATAEIRDVEQTARAALAEIREAIGGYRSRGLAAEIEAARATLDAAGVKLLAEGNPPQPAALTPQEETALALVVREAVTNIVRHAQASTCRLHYLANAGHRQLVVEDDGQHAAIREGNGLRGMRERIESLGGHFLLERSPAQNCGTRLVIDLPEREVSV